MVTLQKSEKSKKKKKEKRKMFSTFTFKTSENHSKANELEKRVNFTFWGRSLRDIPFRAVPL